MIETNADRIAVEISGSFGNTEQAVQKAVHQGGLLIETSIKAHASGRPGPNAITGHYRGSWTTVTIKDGTGYIARVGTNAPQARRLEYGYRGPDILGRTFNQPPYPHMKPGVQAVEEKVVDLIRKALP